MKYNKLVRDNIPDIIRKNQKKPITHVATDEEYEEKLKEKLREEVEEFIQTPNKEELADIKEVLLALYKLYKIDEKEIEKIRLNKSKERGGFEKRIILDEVN